MLVGRRNAGISTLTLISYSTIKQTLVMYFTISYEKPSYLWIADKRFSY